jgi:protein-disulfide isomerase
MQKARGTYIMRGMRVGQLNRRALAGGLCAGFIGIALSSSTLSQTDPATNHSKLLSHVPSIGERSLGSPEAPVVVVEYASATCPHCAQFHIRVWPQIRETYIQAGKVRWIFRELPLDEAAMAAFMLARCVQPDKYFEAIDLLFARQKTWAQSGTDVKSELFNVMKSLGMNQSQFNQCLEDKELAEAIYMIAKTANTEFGVKATPTFFVNGKLIRGARDFTAFGSIIESELANKGR